MGEGCEFAQENSTMISEYCPTFGLSFGGGLHIGSKIESIAQFEKRCDM